MPESPKVQETVAESEKGPTQEKVAEPETAPDQASPEPETADEKPQPVEVELNPDFELPEGADSVSVEVGSFEALELVKGKTAKVSPEHAFLLNDVPAVRRAE